MKKLILVLMAVLTMTVMGPVDASTYREQKFRYDMWIEACFRVARLHCGTMAPPKVKFERMRRGLYGYYDGGDTVFVNKSINSLQKRATLLHEMIHYIQSKVGGLPVPGPAKLICAAEEEAFRLTDQWLIDIGFPDKVRGPNWWRPYTHCYKWYGNERARRGWWGFVGG